MQFPCCISVKGFESIYGIAPYITTKRNIDLIHLQRKALTTCFHVSLFARPESVERVSLEIRRQALKDSILVRSEPVRHYFLPREPRIDPFNINANCTIQSKGYYKLVCAVI